MIGENKSINSRYPASHFPIFFTSSLSQFTIARVPFFHDFLYTQLSLRKMFMHICILLYEARLTNYVYVCMQYQQHQQGGPNNDLIAVQHIKREYKTCSQPAAARIIYYSSLEIENCISLALQWTYNMDIHIFLCICK